MGTNSHYRPGTKRKRGGNGQDFRWKKAKTERRRGREEREMVSGDALDDDLPQRNSAQNSNVGKKQRSLSAKKRHVEVKRRRQEQHERERQEADEQMRKAPHEYLWSRFVTWAGDKLTEEDLAEEWGTDNVVVLEDSGDSFIAQLKTILGDDYATRGEYAGGTAGVAVIALAASAVNAVKFAPKLYDGFPVGKLFSKHVKIQEQKEWLARVCRKRLPPSAAGTAKRIHRLIEEGDLSLDFTVGLVIDMSRDLRLLNIVEMDSTRAELFELIHDFARPLLAKGKLKIILCIPKDQPTKLEDVKDELMTRLTKAEERRKKSGKAESGNEKQPDSQ